MYKITKWTKNVTDNGEDQTVCGKPKDLDYKFKLLDDDNLIYAYGYSSNDSSFAPLDQTGVNYGCTRIDYYNKDKKEWEIL